jgi:Soluble lytic murein transglycosylase and related regulatory proteins (some contain LysM/invasin domains)
MWHNSGSQYNVPQSIILGVIEQESGGNSNNKSSLGAIGLMQIMPSTAQQVASVNNISYTGQNDLFNPVINIQIGTAYLSSLYSRFNNLDDCA